MKTLALALALVLAVPAVGQDRKEALAEYARRYRALDQKNQDQLLELAVWCREKKLETYARLLFRKVLKLDPQNDGANAGMGNVKVAGRWYPPKEAEAVRERLAAEARAAEAKRLAAVHTSMTEPPREKELQEAVRRQVKANAAESDRLRDAYVKAVAGSSSDHGAALTDHALLVAQARPADVDRYAEIAEYVYRRLSWITFGKTDARAFARDGDRHLFYLAAPKAAATTLRFVGRRHPAVAKWNDPERQAELVGESGLQFTAFHKPPCLVHFRLETQSSAVANTMARSFVQHHAKAWHAEQDIEHGTSKGLSMMSWLLEGTGIWASLTATGRNEVYRINSRYVRKFVRDEDEPPNWPGMALDIVTTGTADGHAARTLYQLSRARTSSWNDADLAMSFALVDYFIRARTEDWRGLFQRLPEADSFRVAFVAQLATSAEKEALRNLLSKGDEPALGALFRKVSTRFERAWRDWVRKTYPVHRDNPGKLLEDAPFPDIR